MVMADVDDSAYRWTHIPSLLTRSEGWRKSAISVHLSDCNGYGHNNVLHCHKRRSEHRQQVSTEKSMWFFEICEEQTDRETY